MITRIPFAGALGHTLQQLYRMPPQCIRLCLISSVVLVWLCSQTAWAALNVRYQDNIQGGATLFGNSFYLQTNDWNGAYTILRADVDGDPSTSISSSSDLILPPGATVVKAFLSVETMYGLVVGSADFDSVKFKTPGGSYTTLNTASAGYLTRNIFNDAPGTGSDRYYRQMVFDVTSLLPTTPTGTYTVADPSPRNDNTADIYNQMGGWALTVVYRNPSATAQFRNITVADNWNFFNTAGEFVNVDIPNVIVPSSGTVNAVVGMTGTYGDPLLTDYVRVGNAAGVLTVLTDPTTGRNNDALDGSIGWAANNNVSADGGSIISGNYTARNPNTGFSTNYSSYYATTVTSAMYDADIFNATGAIPANATPITVRVQQNSDGGDWLISGTYFVSVDLPAATLTKTMSPATVSAGTKTTYTFTIANTAPGNVNLTGLGFTDSLPSALIVASPNGVTLNNCTGASVTAVPGTGSISVSGLSLAAGQSCSVSVDAINKDGFSNEECANNPAAFTNGSSNITTTSGLLRVGVTAQCLLVTPVDRSDAPAGYGAPTHTIVAGTRLGATVTTENAAYNSANADGDVDDGISLPTLTQNQTSTITATVAGAGGYLQGWVDFNGDGDFADAGEQVANNIQDNLVGDTNNTAGTIAFSVNVPANAVTTQTYARFRWSSTLNLDATTDATNGEVEDYALTIFAQFEPELPNSVCTMNAYGWADTHTPVGSGGGEPNPPYSLVTGSYDWDAAGNPQWTGSSTPTYSALASLVNTSLPELDLTDSSTGQNEAWMTITRLEGSAGSAGTAIIQDGGALEHKVFIITDAAGNVLTRYPSVVSTSTNTAVTPPGERNLSGLVLSFNYPTDGVAYVHIYVVDYSTYREVPYVASCLEDFSDAPASYGSPAHTIIRDLQLGSTAPDSEANAQPTVAANGDDTTSIDDENGVNLPIEFKPNQMTSITVNVLGASGRLQAWIDWNADGDFADKGEQIAKNLADNASTDTDATTGVITFNVTPPATALIGSTYARFRWSTQTNLNATAAANDGEVEDYAVTVAANGTALSIAGRVFNDVNVNGIDNTEAGIKDVTIVLHDTLADTCKSTQTAADGSYQFTDLAAGTYTVLEAVGAKRPTPTTCPPTAKDPNGWGSTTSNALAVTLSTNAVNDADFGEVRAPSFSLDHSKVILPNTTITYPHVFQAYADGNVLFNIAAEQADPATLNWGVTLFLDNNCDAKLGQGDAAITSAYLVNAGDKLCVLTKVAAPADAPAGALHVLSISSDFQYGDGSLLAANDIQTHTDRTQTAAGSNTEDPTKPISGEGKLSLEKTVWNVTRNIEGSVALPGETLRYTIHYENIGNGLLNELVIQDSVPEFTQLVPNSLLCGATPPELSACSTQVNVTSLEWTFSGQLKAGSNGEVSYEVQVE